MSRRPVRLALVLGAGVLVCAAGPAGAAPAEAPPAPPPGEASKAPPPPAPERWTPPKPGEKAEEHFKNIQALKGIPADELIPAMQFISASLGVDCEFCHVEHHPEADDKKEKKTARSMITMTLAIDHDHFDGKLAVTCMSCHRGATHPVGMPAVATADERPEESAEAPPPALPEASAVLDRYVKAVGGADALAKIVSRVQTGHLSGFGPQPFPIEIYAKAPNMRVSVVTTPRGESVTAFDGTSGWLGGGGRPPHDMSAAENRAARLEADMLFPADVRDLFLDVRTAPPVTIDGKDAIHVVATNEGDPPVELFFDPASGLLLREIRYVQTPLGRMPTQVDFADYRDADGVKIPFRWTIARPGGRFTIQIDETKQNVPVDDARFRKSLPG
jgi:photosynthetic reaction center cytochrome c subunit